MHRLRGDTLLFGPHGRFAGDRDGFFFGFSDTYEVRRHSRSFMPMLVIRREVRPRALPRGLVDEYKRRILGMGGEDGRPVPPRLHAQREQLLAEMQFSSTIPVFSTLLADRTGHLWVKEYDPEEELPPAKPGPVSIRTFERPSRWDVFDPQGRWLCTVEMPGSFTPLEIGADHVAGVWRDTDDVEHVRLYRLIKP